MLTRLRKSGEISADTLELCGGHLDGRGIFGLGNTQVLLVNVHELDVIFADSVTVGALEDDVDDIGRVLGLECENIVRLSSTEDLLQRCEVDTKGNVAVASKGGE